MPRHFAKGNLARRQFHNTVGWPKCTSTYTNLQVVGNEYAIAKLSLSLSLSLSPSLSPSLSAYWPSPKWHGAILRPVLEKTFFIFPSLRSKLIFRRRRDFDLFFRTDVVAGIKKWPPLSFWRRKHFVGINELFRLFKWLWTHVGMASVRETWHRDYRYVRWVSVIDESNEDLSRQ